MNRCVRFDFCWCFVLSASSVHQVPFYTTVGVVVLLKDKLLQVKQGFALYLTVCISVLLDFMFRGPS